MSKDEKHQGIPKPADQRRVDPSQGSRKSGRSRKVYPPHWQVRFYGWGEYHLDAYKVRPVIPFIWNIDQSVRPNRHDLSALLAWYAERFPHTATLPVRFISCQPVECGREVIPN